MSDKKDKEKLKTFLGGMLTLSLLLSLIFCVFYLISNYIIAMAYGFDEHRKNLLSQSFFWLIQPFYCFYH